MNDFFKRISSRKFLISLFVQVASVIALFYPEQNELLQDGAVKIASLGAMVLSALGYATIEAKLDATENKSIDSEK